MTGESTYCPRVAVAEGEVSSLIVGEAAEGEPPGAAAHAAASKTAATHIIKIKNFFI
jgi:phytoene/squalene synthetase